MSSITLHPTAEVRYVLRLADMALILAQRLSEWCGHAPVLEEDIALTNMSLDLLGQSRALLTHAGQLHAKAAGVAFNEDQLAFLREERDFLNPTLCELPNTADDATHRRSRPGDFAFTVLRNLMVSTWLKLAWGRLTASCDPELAAIAAKALKEARYHSNTMVIGWSAWVTAPRSRMSACNALWTACGRTCPSCLKTTRWTRRPPAMAGAPRPVS